jgi:hypothetical protein
MYKAISSLEPDAADKDFFEQLRRQLNQEISSYVYESHPEAIGIPLSSDQIRGDLDLMRVCLVEPHWEEANLCITNGVVVKRMCVTMAEEEGYVLVFDPIGEEYHLAWRGENGLGSFGIRGDGVGCFLAR